MAASSSQRSRHIINISGGKDSAAVALIAADRGQAFDLWMADTGNENQITWDYAHYLADFLGKELNIARADFSEQIAKKRKYVAEKWPEDGVPETIVARALDILQPTGNPFLDLCIWKGRFPSRRAQFCTEFLKARAMADAVVDPALECGRVVQWLGVRRDESLNRRTAPMFQRVRRSDKPHDILLFRPIIHWTAENVFAWAAHRGLRPNPLYLQGFGRVGCFPCINANKAELALIGRMYSEVIEKLAQWEWIVKQASKRGAATFFASDLTPEGATMGRRIKKLPTDERPAAIAAANWPNAHRVFDWAKTTRGGRQYDLLSSAEDEFSCSSQYGLCE
ncbi:phosphoadenosine phosphosulfate reductase domain-containing protein [Roseinatronobacter sp. NSM]|uniref:phosphoadenosine phosphosulfate reductase domain-containing protein n=1 Tax=Roseinatronobacter sp. NSM TaxID=3457785 RepID=UPI004035A2B5